MEPIGGALAPVEDGWLLVEDVDCAGGNRLGAAVGAIVLVAAVVDVLEDVTPGAVRENGV